MKTHGSVAASVRREKEKHPEFYCRVPSCLWRTFSPRTGRETPCGKHGGHCSKSAETARAAEVEA